MAADRAAELTEADRILSDEGRRTEYDRALAAVGGAATASPVASAGAPRPRLNGRAVCAAVTRAASRDRHAPGRPAVPAGARHPRRSSFERPRSGLCAWHSPPRAATMRVTRAASTSRWCRRASSSRGTETRGCWAASCRRSIGRRWPTRGRRRRSGAAPRTCACCWSERRSRPPASSRPRSAITKKHGTAGGAKLVLIPVDVRDWDARMPLDAPPVAKSLLARLKSGAYVGSAPEHEPKRLRLSLRCYGFD
jgi:hypothetical protein